MTLRTRDLKKAFTTTAPIEYLTGGRVARAHRVLTTHVQADHTLGNWRNVVARAGLHGSGAFHVVSANPASATQVYPLRTASRVVARVPAFAVLPGHFLRLSALVVPSGMTNRLTTSYIADIACGWVDVSITWTGTPGVFVTTHELALPTSSETWAAENTASGAAWAGLRRIEIPLMFPEAALNSTADRQAWSEGVTAEVTISHRGGTRAVDVVLQQVPVGYARDIGTDTTYSSSMVTDAAGLTVKTYPVNFPVEERSATDPTYGSALLADIADRQHTALGPVLVHWTAWDEATTAVGASASPSASTTSISFVDMLNGGSTWSAATPGWSLSAGSTAQQFKSSNARREMRGNNACVPVRCWAYCARTVAGAATLRFQTEHYSIAELVFDSVTPGWRSCTGHLRTGAHPEDPSGLLVFGKATAGSTLHLYQFCIEYLDL